MRCSLRSGAEIPGRIRIIEKEDISGTRDKRTARQTDIGSALEIEYISMQAFDIRVPQIQLEGFLIVQYKDLTRIRSGSAVFDLAKIEIKLRDHAGRIVRIKKMLEVSESAGNETDPLQFRFLDLTGKIRLRKTDKGTIPVSKESDITERGEYERHTVFCIK